MLQRSIIKRTGQAAALLALLLIGLESLSFGNRCQPPTPGPCGADGVCRPVGATWGYSRTRWRPWPAETIGKTPTDAGVGEAGEEPKGLKPFEVPDPLNEDLRGPAKNKKKKDDNDQPVDDAPMEGPPVELPGPDAEALPAIDPFGSIDDAPPALPASLRQAAQALNLSNPPIAVYQPAAQPIRPVQYQPVATPLINPASATVVQPEAETLQQAIYYEASDHDQ